MSGGFFDVDTSALRGVAASLSAAGGDVTSASAGLTAAPDAGQSSDEVLAAIGALKDAVAALGEKVSGNGSELTQTAADYDASDLSSSQTVRGTAPAGIPGVTR